MAIGFLHNRKGVRLTGDADVSDVLASKTFYKDSYREKKTGTLTLTGDAIAGLVWFRYSHSLQSLVPTTDYTYTTSLAGGLTTIQQDVKKQNESFQKQIDELRAIIASMAV